MKRLLDGRKSQPPPAEALPDLMAGTLAGRSFAEAIAFLETERDGLTLNDTFFLTYLYCLNGDVDKVEAPAQGAGGSRCAKMR